MSAFANDQAPINIVILGGGKGGYALLELFSHLPSVKIMGIADIDPTAPALIYAEHLHIRVTHDPIELIRQEGTHLIINVTGDPEIDRLIEQHKRPETEVLGGVASKLLWLLVRQEAQTQAQLLQAEKLASMGTFAAGIAHDINNPLYVIQGFAENILEETDLAIIREQARSILDASKRIQSICVNITQYARASLATDVTPVELHAKLEEALKIARYATTIHDVTIVREYNGKLEVMAKPQEILQVFVNLLTNAIQAMNGKGTLTLTTWQEQNQAKVAIRDTGCGIPPEYLDKIFEPFFTTKSPGKGTGLGLYNVRTIVNKYAGTLSIDSQVGKGTTFTLTFPLVEHR